MPSRVMFARIRLLTFLGSERTRPRGAPVQLHVRGRRLNWGLMGHWVLTSPHQDQQHRGISSPPRWSLTALRGGGQGPSPSSRNTRSSWPAGLLAVPVSAPDVHVVPRPSPCCVSPTAGPPCLSRAPVFFTTLLWSSQVLLLFFKPPWGLGRSFQSL